MAVRISARPLQPLTGQGLASAFDINAILYVLGSSPLPSYSPSYPAPAPCPAPPSPLHSGFGGAQPAAPTKSPSFNLGIYPASYVSLYSSSQPPSSTEYRLRLPVPWPSIISDIPSPLFLGVCLQPHPVKASLQRIELGLDPPQDSGGNHHFV